MISAEYTLPDPHFAAALFRALTYLVARYELPIPEILPPLIPNFQIDLTPVATFVS